MKKFKFLFLLVVFSLLLIGLITVVGSGVNRDLRLVSYGDWGVELTNFSFQRRLVSVSVIPAETKLWIPGGYSWYEAGKIGKLAQLTDEKQKLVAKMLFYNFGFVANKVVNKENPDWWRPRFAMLGINGLGWWWNWEMSSRSMLENNEPMAEVDKERMEREFADINWLSDSRLRWVVVNRSGISGLATMLGERLEWVGVWVSGVTNDIETDSGCIIKKPVELAELDEEIIDSISEIMTCDVEINSNSNLTEVVVELGKRWGEMLKYDNYVRAF
jgi:hypothetical protein